MVRAFHQESSVCTRGRGALSTHQRVEWNVWSRPCVWSRGQVVSVGLAGDLEDGDRQLLLDLVRGLGEPLSVGPRLQHSGGVLVACLCLGFDIVEGVEDEQCLLQRSLCSCRKLVVLEGFDKRCNIVAAVPLCRWREEGEGRRGGERKGVWGEAREVSSNATPQQQTSKENFEQL